MSAGNGELVPQDADGGDELARSWANLHQKIETLLKTAGLGPTQFAKQYGMNPSSVTRWRTEWRLPSRLFMEKLLTAAETATAPLPEQDRQAVFDAWWRVIELGHYPHLQEVVTAHREEMQASREQIDAQAQQIRTQLREIRDKTQQVQHLTALLSQAYYTIRWLEANIVQLRQAGRYQEADAREAELKRAWLQVSHLRAQRDLVRSQTALLEDQLPIQIRSFYEVDQGLPGRESVPPWWRDPAEVPAVAPSPPLYPPTQPPSGDSGLIFKLLAVMLAAALVLLGFIAWREFSDSGSRTSARPSASSPPTASEPASDPAPPAASTSPSPTVSSPSASPVPSETSAPELAVDSGWDVQYRDRITVPAGQACVGSSVDFEIPRGYEGTSNLLTGTYADLTIQPGCGAFLPAGVSFYDQPRGRSSAQEPGPEQCLTDANRNAVPSTISMKQFGVGAAFCLVTPQGSLIWFKVVAVTGSAQEGRILQATSWSQKTSTSS